jgi:hypothetical protein
LLSTAVHEPKMWDNLKGQFMSHIEEVNADLRAAGRPTLGSELNVVDLDTDKCSP